MVSTNKPGIIWQVSSTYTHDIIPKPSFHLLCPPHPQQIITLVFSNLLLLVNGIMEYGLATLVLYIILQFPYVFLSHVPSPHTVLFHITFTALLYHFILVIYLNTFTYYPYLIGLYAKNMNSLLSLQCSSNSSPFSFLC